MRVLVVGAASWDTIVHLDALPTGRAETLFARDSYEAVGSTGAGKALNLARLGHEVHLHTLLGPDDAGRRVARALTDAGVHLHADAVAAGTEQHVNLMGPDGSRVSIYRSVAAPRPDLDLTPVVELAGRCDAVVLNITDYVRRLVTPLLELGIPFWTDLHDWDGVNPYHADFTAAASIVLSADALPDPERVCARLAAGGRLVVCTRGADGATAWAGGAPLEVPARPVATVVDTNGAGDAFTAGLIHGLHTGWPLTRALAAAAVAGATAVTSRGLASPDLTADLLARETEARGGSR